MWLFEKARTLMTIYKNYNEDLRNKMNYERQIDLYTF